MDKPRFTQEQVEKLRKALRKGAPQVVGYSEQGQRQRDYAMGWNEAMNSVWTALGMARYDETPLSDLSVRQLVEREQRIHHLALEADDTDEYCRLVGLLQATRQELQARAA